VSRRKTNACLRDPITVRSTASGISILYHCSFGFFWIAFYPFPPLFSSPFFYLNISPVPTCLVHNCETSRSIAISICCYSCLEIKFPFDPHQCETNVRLRDPITVRSTSSELSICYYCSFGFFWIIFYPSPPL